MAKKHNILNDKAALKTILEELTCFCDVHTSCLYCPFHNGDHCLLVVNGRTPLEYFEEDDDE